MTSIRRLRTREGALRLREGLTMTLGVEGDGSGTAAFGNDESAFIRFQTLAELLALFALEEGDLEELADVAPGES